MGSSKGAAVARWGLPLGPLAAVLVALPWATTMSRDARLTAALAVWMAIWWITEAIPIPATALLPLLVLPATGVASSAEAAAPYAHHLIFLFMGGFFLAKAMERWGLHRRVALQIVVRTGGGPRRLVLGVMLATAFLSMWISNTATAVMMLPIGTALVKELRRAPGSDEVAREAGDDHFAVALMLGIAYAASIGGVATLIGTPPNLVFATVGDELVGVEVGFLSWMAVGLPVTALLLPLCWLYLTRWACRLPDRLPMARNLLDEQLRRLGSMGRGEIAVASVFLLTATGWILREEKVVAGRAIPGIETLLPQVSDATIAVAGALAVFCLPLSLRRRRFVLDWETAAQIPWGVLILFGGGLSLAQAFGTTGLSEWIAGWVAEFRGLPVPAIVLAACTLIIFLTELTSNTATASMAMPVFASAAAGLGMHPYTLMAPAAIAASLAFMLPVATPPNAIVFGSGEIRIGQMARVGFALNLISILVATGASVTLVPLLLG